MAKRVEDTVELEAVQAPHPGRHSAVRRGLLDLGGDAPLSAKNLAGKVRVEYVNG